MTNLVAAIPVAVREPHVCRWGPIQRWVRPSSLQAGGTWERVQRESVPYRECACGETVWGARVNSAYVLDNLASLSGGEEAAR